MLPDSAIPRTSPLSPYNTGATADGSTVAPPLIASEYARTDGQGRMVAVFTSAGKAWQVYRITVTSDTDGTAYVYVGPAGQLTPDCVVSGTWSAKFDENDAHQPYYVPQGTSLSVLFTNGGTCTARIEYAEVS